MKVFTRFTWTTGDQVLSAFGNVIPVLSLTRYVGLDAAGEFSVAFAAYLVCLGFVRALILDPALSEERTAHSVGKVAVSVGSLTLVGAVIQAVVLVTLGLVFELAPLVVLAFVLPLLLLQDAGRYLAFQQHRPELAAWSDGIWLGVNIALAVALSLDWGWIQSTSGFVLWWGLGAGAGLAIVWKPVGLGVRSARSAIVWWRSRARRMAVPLVAESVVYALGNQLVWLLVAGGLGAAALGSLRATQVLFAPVQVLTTGFVYFAVPELTGRAGLGWSRVRWVMMAPTLGAGAASIATLVLFVPLSNLIYEQPLALSLALPVAVGVVLGALGAGSAAVLRAARTVPPLLKARVASSVVTLAAVVPLTSSGGLVGAAWALSMGGATYSLVAARAAATRRRWWG